MIHTQQALNDMLDYDPLTGILVWKIRPTLPKSWNTKYAGKQAFTAINAYGYYVGGINARAYQASRVIFVMVHGYEPKQVDHIDGNPLNNKLCNLRAVDHFKNQQNTKKRTTNTSGIVGVCWDSFKCKWLARIGINGKTKHLGRFDTIEEATAARKAAEIAQGYHPNHGR